MWVKPNPRFQFKEKTLIGLNTKNAFFKERAISPGPLLFCIYFNNYYVIRMGWFFSVLPVSVDDSGADSLVICSSVVCRGSSCTGWRCSGLKFSWLWSFLTRQGKLFRLLFVCNYCCRRKNHMQVHFYSKVFLFISLKWLIAIYELVKIANSI